MSSPPILDFAKLTAPIAGENPAGADLRADPSPTSPYYAIKDGRNKARADERRAQSSDEEVPPPDWRPVRELGFKILAEKTKDLEVVAYLIEAVTRIHGFAGIRDGFRLARELVEKYWDKLYPLPDEEGVDTRVAPLTGLNGDDAEGTLIAPINQIPLTESKGEPPFNYSHYQQAQALGKVADPKAREKKIEAGAITMEMIGAGVSASSPAFYATLVKDLTDALDEFAKLNAVLDQKCGGRSPPSSTIRGALSAIMDCVKDIARNKLDVAAPPKDDPKAAAATGAAGPAGTTPAKADALATREDAFRLLNKVAEFFRNTEPHSPVSYAVEQAVRWGKMPLPELILELIPDEGPRKGYFKQVGIKPPEPPKEEKKK